ncbi:cytochrome c maturation protein CcmE [Suttonella sp. R2A3]|uniref:cytochrome c maturation protein CcmE n=1 Tax=Suttonella sp. R2A3 TaxID=2908648 RepID=UPI001F39930F|nr:cytochrome c maturation protein CcmE [Suttonella sp. R2A3]UJF24739.1 cytochrome c maturation protein CcmE [Suttonella sp. R2A3]
MKPVKKKRLKLIVLIFVVASLAITLLLFAMRENLNHYYSLEAVSKGTVPVEQPGIRVGGMVQSGSIVRTPDSLDVTFRITDFKNTPLTMHYSGILPDLFRDNQGVIARGKLGKNGAFYADEILAKHDENYMPPEVAQDMERSGYDHQQGDTP